MKESLRYLRERANLSQSQVAAELGISRQTYIKFESGDTEPSLALLRHLAALYQVALQAIIENSYSVREPVPSATAALSTGGDGGQHAPSSRKSCPEDIYATKPMEPCVVSSPSPVYEGVFDGTCVRPLDLDFPARINQKVTITLQDEYLVDKATLIKKVYGRLHHGADPSKWPLEEKAWELHCMEKYGPAKKESDIQEEDK